MDAETALHWDERGGCRGGFSEKDLLARRVLLLLLLLLLQLMTMAMVLVPRRGGGGRGDALAAGRRRDLQVPYR
jgi:hypothetical protein